MNDVSSSIFAVLSLAGRTLLVLVLVSSMVLGSLPVFQQRVVPTSAVRSSYAGYSVAITPSGLRAVVGAPGNIYNIYAPPVGFVSVYDRTGSTWKETAKLKANDDPVTIVDEGYKVSIARDGFTVVSGCPSCNNLNGTVYVFEHIGGSWNGGVSLIEAYPQLGAQMGVSVAISQDGQTIACMSDGGAVIFAKTHPGVWHQQGPRLSVEEGTSASIVLSGDGAFLLLGLVSVDPQFLVFYKRNSSLMWYQSGPYILPGPNNTLGISAGLSMTADGSFVVAGGYGAASVFKLSDDTTTYLPLQELIAPGSKSNGYGSGAVGISSLGEHIIIGDRYLYGSTPVPNSTSTYTKGGAFIFKLLSDRAGFGLVGNITMPFFNATLNAKSNFGSSVAVSDHGNFLAGAQADYGYTGATFFFVTDTCRPAYMTTLGQCTTQNKTCGGNLKWVKKGCKARGSRARLGDGGCQCQGYCGFSCRNACNRDRQCVWATKSKKCLVRATGEVGASILSC